MAIDRRGERLLGPFGGGGGIVLRRGGARELGRWLRALARRKSLRHDEAQHFPLGDLIAEVVDHAAGQLDFEQVGLVALHERRGADEQRAATRRSARGRTRGRNRSSLRSMIELVAAEIGAAEPGQVVLAAHVNVVEPAGRNAIAIVNH